jgi:ribosomal protein S12 methylthiotransferase
MLGLLAQAGVVPTPDPRDADVIVINTCGFLEASKQESLDAIAQAARFKTARRPRRIVVAGCLATRMGKEILAHVPQVDALVGVHQRDRIVEAVLGTVPFFCCSKKGTVPLVVGPHKEGDSPHFQNGRKWGQSPDTARLRLTPRHYAYLRISDGCNRGCSFCTIPAIRGPLRSKPIEQIEAEATELIADGAIELNMIGQDTTSYGLDFSGRRPNENLAGLLRRLDRLPGVQWLRLLYAYPNGFGDELIDAIASCPHVLPYVDIPLQHINDRILRLMKRRVTRSQTERLLAKLRRRIPGIALRTTFISGFPGETEQEHRELLGFVEDFGFDMLGVFSYSQELGTAAGRMPGQIPADLRDERRAELMAGQQKIVLRRNAALIGTRATALVDSRVRPGVFAARTASQAPEVDSVTLVKAGRGRPVIKPGQLLPVRITGFRGYDLLAETQ